MSCQTSPRKDVQSPVTTVNPPSLPKVPNAPPVAPKPQPIKFSFNVDSLLEDLKVKQGEYIRKGQIIADLTEKRLNLETKKRTLEAKLNTISQTSVVPVSTQVEEENLASAQAQVAAAQTLLRDYEQSSPWTDFARDNLPLVKEEVELTRLRQNLKVAQKNFEQAQAKLVQKQSAIRSLKDDQGATQVGLQQALLSVEQELTSLKPIQSRFSGTITKIDVAKIANSDQALKVTFTLLPGDEPKVRPSASGGLPTELPQDKPPQPSTAGAASDLLPSGINRPTQTDVPGSSPLPNPTVE